MQDNSILSPLDEDNELNFDILKTDYEIRSKTTTAKTEQQRPPFRLPSIPTTDSIPSPKTTHPPHKPPGYAPPASDRESWWRVTIKNTPNPGTYNTHLNTFLKELVGRPSTYGFKSDGRRRDPQPLEPKGKDLLPGAYSVEDFVERMNRLTLSYGFKGPQRQDLLNQSITANQDKDIDVAPGLYETQKYHTINVPVEAARHSFFKSKTRRKPFLPKIGPAPSDYEPRTSVINVNGPTITSSFRSRTDRFHKKALNVPGPGTYEQLMTLPSLKQIDRFSSRGVFYNASFVHKATAAV